MTTTTGGLEMPSASEEEVLDAVRDVIMQILNDRGETVEAASIERSMALYDYDETVESSLELDSMDALDVITLLEERFGTELPPNVEVEEIRTVGDVVAVIHQAVNAG